MERRACLATEATTNRDPLRFRVLGPLEARAGQRAVELGGRRPRAVLAALLLRAGEVVSVERLIDDTWGDTPPASAAHSLEAYVSRLRGALAEHGVGLERRGGGYRIDLHSAVLDSQLCEALVERAAEAALARDNGHAAALAKEALDLWAGPALSGVPLHGDGRAAAERLEELRSRALEIRIDADLALGRHAEVVGELRRLLEESPYRERLVGQLILALYRCGRQAEALDVYEHTRRALDEDLGLQPSEELQRLAGQVVRQEPQLRAPDRPEHRLDDQRITRRRTRKMLAVALVVAAAAGVALALGLTIPTDAVVRGGQGATRVALIRMWDPGKVGGADEAGWRPFVEGFLRAERTHDLQTAIVDLFPRRPPAGGFEPGSPDDVERLSARLRSGNFDLVLWPLGLTGPNFFVVVPQNPDTRFVFLDYCCIEQLGGAQNATALRLRGDQAGQLAGYLSGLMEARRPLTNGDRHTVSTITGEPYFEQEKAWERGYVEGATRALPGVNVRVDHSFEYDNRSTCERIANRQIDAGSTVIFAAAGECGLGALSAAAIRGIWGVGVYEDRSHLGPHVLASAIKRFDRLVELSVSWYLEERLPSGEDVELGLADGAVALVGISPEVPRDIRRKLGREAARLAAIDSAPSG